MKEEFNLSEKEDIENLRELDGTIDSRILEIYKKRRIDKLARELLIKNDRVS